MSALEKYLNPERQEPAGGAVEKYLDPQTKPQRTRSPFNVLSEISGATAGEPASAPAQPVASHKRFGGGRSAQPTPSHLSLSEYTKRRMGKYDDVQNALNNDTRSEMLVDSGVQNVASRVDEYGAGALRVADVMPGSGIKIVSQAAEMLGLTGPDSLKRAADWLQKRGNDGVRAVQDYQNNLEVPLTTSERAFQGAVEMPGDVALSAIAAEAGGPTLGFAGQSGLGAIGRGEDAKTVLQETARGGLQGAIFRGASPIQSRIGRAATVGGLTFTLEKAFGSDNSQATHSAATNALFALLGGGRPREQRKALFDLERQGAKIEKVDAETQAGKTQNADGSLSLVADAPDGGGKVRVTVKPQENVSGVERYLDPALPKPLGDARYAPIEPLKESAPTFGVNQVSTPFRTGVVDQKAVALSDLKNAYGVGDSPAIEDAFARARTHGASDTEIRSAIGDTAKDDMAKEPSHTLKENIYSALNIPRSIITAGDLSASARQGAVLSAGHPIKAARAFKAQVEAFASEAKARETLDNLAKDKSVQEGVKSGLFMPDLMDDSLTVAQREEAFGSRFTKHLPLVARSERAFNVFLNKLRADVWKDVYESHPGMTETDKAELARTLNVLTGRGSLPGPLDRHAADLAQVLFAPRLLASRVESPLLLASKSPVARREAARNLVSFVGANLAFLGTAKLAGADIELDPRSSDFLRVRVGNTRIDLAAGYQAPIRYVAQALMGQRKSVDTGEVKDLDWKKRVKVAANFARTRLAPQIGIPIDLITGKNVAGEKVGPVDAALSGIEYLSARDIAEAVKEDRRQGGTGARGAALGSLSIIGVSVSTYHSTPATEGQKDYVKRLAKRAGETVDADNLSKGEASREIERLKAKLDQ